MSETERLYLCVISTELQIWLKNLSLRVWVWVWVGVSEWCLDVKKGWKRIGAGVLTHSSEAPLRILIENAAMPRWLSLAFAAGPSWSWGSTCMSFMKVTWQTACAAGHCWDLILQSGWMQEVWSRLFEGSDSLTHCPSLNFCFNDITFFVFLFLFHKFGAFFMIN